MCLCVCACADAQVSASCTVLVSLRVCPYHCMWLVGYYHSISLCPCVCPCVCVCVCVCVCLVVQPACTVTSCRDSPDPLTSLPTTLSWGTTCHPQVQSTPLADQGTKTRPRQGSEANLSLPKSRSFKIKALADELAKDLRTSPKQAAEAHTKKHSFPLKVRNIKYPFIHSFPQQPLWVKTCAALGR